MSRPTEQDEAAFSLALGRFVIAWADAEFELYRVLCRYCGIADGVARAILSGTRARNMIDFLYTIMHNTAIDADRAADLAHVLPQMASINTMRDHLTHFLGASYGYHKDNPSARLLTNSGRVSRPGKQFAHMVDAKTLRDMTWDLYGIVNHLNQHWMPERLGRQFHPWREQNPDDPPTPWRYKSPQPIGKPGKSPSTLRKRGAPRKTSPKKRGSS